MRKVYIAVALFFIASLALFILSFIFLDKDRHRVRHYTIAIEGQEIGTVRVDRFRTEDKLVYKSTATLPLAELFTGIKSRITLDKDRQFESYLKESDAGTAGELLFLDRKADTLTFVSRFNSRFAFLDKIPIKKDICIFEEGSPVTYFPIIEKYDFSKGRSQGFNALYVMPDPSLPPMPCYLTLTSIRDEYLKIGPRKIKTENILIKIKGHPTGYLWVSKFDRSIIKVEYPDKNLVITRTFSPHKIDKIDDRAASADAYVSREESFENNKTRFTGTVTIPKTDAKYPAVLLVWEDGPQDRDGSGIFYSIADHLSRNGFAVMRFDKRGVGSSSGNYEARTPAEELSDISAAMEFLKNQSYVDPDRTYLLGYGLGAYYSLKAASSGLGVRGIVMMDPELPYAPSSPESVAELKDIAFMDKWDAEYLALAERSMAETYQKAKYAKRDWIYLFGKWCFAGSIKEEITDIPEDSIKAVKVPVLILQGKAGREVLSRSAASIDKMMADAGNQSHALKYYSYLDHHFGKYVNDGIFKAHYEVDKDVLDHIGLWLKQNNLTLDS